MKPIRTLRVKLDGRPVGKLALPPNQPYQFAYDADWLAAGFNLSPIHMAFSRHPQAAPQDFPDCTAFSTTPCPMAGACC